MQVFTQRKWLEEGRKRFGDNINHWKFICPACGRKQSIDDFNKQGIRYGFAHVYFCCISTFDTAKLCGFTCAAKWQAPITWGIQKVIRLHKWEVISRAGLFVPVFQFADAERKEQAVIRAVKPESFFGRSESARKARPLFSSDALTAKVIQNDRGGWSIMDGHGAVFGNFPTAVDAERVMKLNGWI